MLDAASVNVDETGETLAFPATKAGAAYAPARPPARYGVDRGIDVPVVLAVVLAHVMVFFAAAYFSPQFTREVRQSLRVVDIRLDPPPAPPAPPQPKDAPEVKLQTAVSPPRPVIQLVSAVQTPVQIAPPAPVIAPAAPPALPAAPAAPGVVQGGDLGARMVAGKPPRYPIECRRKREQGTVLLALVVGLDGKVQTISIARSSGFDRLDTAARDAVRNWRWEPAIRDGQAVLVRGVVEIPFVLQG